MKLQELNLNVAGVVGAPISIATPEPTWLEGRESGAIPEPLFRLYEQAKFLSFGAAPSFLADPDNLLFSYYGMLVRGLRRQLQESSDLVAVMHEAHSKVYTPIKKAKGMAWDPTADSRANQAFRDLLGAAYSTLDILAELIAVVFTGRVSGLKVGRAQFATVEDWLRKEPTETPDPNDVLGGRFVELRQRLSKRVMSGGSEKDWLGLLRLLRNKSAHLGDDVFRYFGLFDPKGDLFMFIPREWPYFFQMHMKQTGSSESAEPFPEFLKKTLVAEDYISFAAGLNRKIKNIVADTADVLHGSIKIVSGNGTNQFALTQLKGNPQAFEFQLFDDDGPLAG